MKGNRKYYLNLQGSLILRANSYRESGLPTGADTGIHSGGWEILKRENVYKKGKKGRVSIKTFFKNKACFNVFIGFFLILYWGFSQKMGKIGLLFCSGGCGRLPASPLYPHLTNHHQVDSYLSPPYYAYLT